MRENKAISAPKHYVKQTERIYEIYTYKAQDEHRFFYSGTKNVGCQYDAIRTDITCACRNGAVLKRREMYFSGLPKQVYAYHGTRSVTDVGVGSVKALQRRRVKRIYLPETDDRGIGSEDLSAFVTRRTRPITRSDYYDHKKTSSKCVGGIAEYNTGCVLNEKLSPIVQTRSEATSPSEHRINIEMASNTVGNDMVTTTTQVEGEFSTTLQDNLKHTEKIAATNIKLKEQDDQKPTCSKDKECIPLDNPKNTNKKSNQVDRGVSSDSLVQHVHNLENPSDYKQSHTSVDPMENKLEREYRKIFSSKPKDKRLNEKPIPDMKSTSILRRRFEALRRGLVKKEDSNKNTVIDNQESVQASSPIRKDVSIASDPPSLEGRSYSDTKIYTPYHMNSRPEKPICKTSTSNKKSYEKTDKHSLQWPQMANEDSDCQGVKGMFKLWGKKFNLEEDSYKKRSTPMSSYQRVNTFSKQPEKKAELKLEKTVKKDGKKFFFFNKKVKEKSKPYKSKKGLTAGRCEVGEGLMIKIDGNTLAVDEPKNKIEISDEILRQQWLNKYLTHPTESKNSVQIRWNNNIYATSSSTVFELMDTVYQGTGIVFRSKSEVTTGDSSFYRSRTQHVNFAHQEIEAWMIPKTVIRPPKHKRIKMKRTISKDNTEVRMSAQKWFIDKAKAFSRKIEVVLHTKNVVNTAKESSSEYFRIDIPKGFFIDSSSEENRKPSSDEEVFKIVEYETESDLKGNKDFDTGDHPGNDVKLVVKKRSNLEPNILESVIKKPSVQRDVVIQGSDVHILKPCDVIGVGIITQKDLREIRKPILKIQETLTNEESNHNITHTQKKCEFAESYLQDYYRHWTPLGMDLFSWCVSDSQLRCHSQNSQGSYHNQGDGSKSCFTIYDDFQTSAVLSANNDCEPCAGGKVMTNPECSKSDQEDFFKCKWFKKLKIKKSVIDNSGKRTGPKDSLEVSKRRKLYAASDKSKWTNISYCDMNSSSIPSIKGEDHQGSMADESKSAKAWSNKRPCRKHVSMKEDGTYEYVSKSDGSPGGILMFRGASGCDVCREAVGIDPKHATVDPVSCEIPDPPCKAGCVANPNPPCSGKPSDISNKKQASPPTEPLCLSSKIKKSPCQECESDNAPNVSLQKKCSPCDAKPSINEATILCPHFPPCRISQSCQKSLDPLQNCPGKCPSDIPLPEKEDNKPPICLPCSAKCSRVIRTAPNMKCEPCKKSLSPTESDQFPWPLKCQKSNQSTVVPDEKSECPVDCPLSPKYSKDSTTSKEVKSCTVECKDDCANKPDMNLSNKNSSDHNVNSDIECKADCANTREINQSHEIGLSDHKVQSKLECDADCANKPETKQSNKNTPSSSATPPIKQVASQPFKDQCETKTKISGIMVKMKSSKKKTCSKECSTMDVSTEEEEGVIRLSSKERITIRMKEPTPSTEEIREGMNIKVKDDEGNTLYERIDYRKAAKSCRPSVLEDMYKSSDVNRISTPLIIKNVQTSQERQKAEGKDNKSDTSLANVIEIQFKLKILPGDKTTQLNMSKSKNNISVNNIKKSDISSSTQDVFLLKNNDGHFSAKPSTKNDVNIRIVIKNFKTKSDRKRNIKYNDDFSQKISNKFQTVSTGYSDVYTGQNIDNVFSIHRATIDLTDSNEESKFQTKPNENNIKVEFTDQASKLTASSQETKLTQSATETERDLFIGKSYSIEKLNNKQIVEDIQSDVPDEEVRPSLFTDSEDQENIDTTTSNAESGIIIGKPIGREQKKELLKKVFERANEVKVKNKGGMKQLRDMLKVILTSDSSGHDEMAVTSNELLKDVTFASLRPDFFKETDSMNNGYNVESILSLGNECGTKYYPTEEQNSECSKNDEGLLNIERDHGCMCSTFAERLNMCGFREGGCCCRPNRMISEEINCDIKIEDDISCADEKIAELIDVETQSSKYFTGYSASNNSNLIKINPKLLTQSGEISANHTSQEFVSPKFSVDTEQLKSEKEKERNMKAFNRNIPLNISDEDRVIFLKATPTNVSSEVNKSNEFNNPRVVTAPDILQSYATKKAVLEIYSEKTVDADGEHTIAKLPKFVYDKESEICRYQEKLCNYNNVCKKNIVMMSIQR